MNRKWGFGSLRSGTFHILQSLEEEYVLTFVHQQIVHSAVCIIWVYVYRLIFLYAVMTCFCHFVCLSGTKDIPQTVWKRLFNSEYTLPVMQTDRCKYICTLCQICDTFYMGILQWLYKGWLWWLWASVSWWTICVLNDELLTASALWNKRKKDFFM